MKIKTKSAIIGRFKKSKTYDGMDRPTFISIFNINDPHKTSEAPVKRYDFETGIHKIIIKNLEIDYLLAGNDILINDLTELEFNRDKKGHLLITGKQKL